MPPPPATNARPAGRAGPALDGGRLRAARPWRPVVSAADLRLTARLLLPLAVAAGGCAHHRQNQYSYAPPLAPAVYPQPAVPEVVMPAAGPMPVPVGVPPAAPMAMPAAPVPMPAAVPTAAIQPCDPCQQGLVVPAGGSAYAVQTPPCPQ